MQYRKKRRHIGLRFFIFGSKQNLTEQFCRLFHAQCFFEPIGGGAAVFQRVHHAIIGFCLFCIFVYNRCDRQAQICRKTHLGQPIQPRFVWLFPFWGDISSGQFNGIAPMRFGISFRQILALIFCTCQIAPTRPVYQSIPRFRGKRIVSHRGKTVVGHPHRNGDL